MQGAPKHDSPVTIKQLGYLVLLPVFFLLHSYNELFGFIPLSYLFIVGLYIYLFAGIVFLIAFLITRSITVTSFVTFCILLFTLFFGAWHDLIKSITPHTVFCRYSVVLPVSILLTGGMIWYFIKKRRWLPGIASYVSLVVLILCCMDVINFVWKYRQYKIDHNQIYPTRPVSDHYVSCNQPDSSKPDIYCIILDEYTDNRSLSTLWHYDNSGMTSWLINKGFYIPDSSKVNFSFTPYSISSLLNMNYPAIKRGRNLNEWIPNILKAERSMSDNETFDLLRKEHYTIHFFGPFKNSFTNLGVDRTFDHYTDVFNRTFPGRLIQDLAWFEPTAAITYKKLHSDNRLIIDSIKSTTNISVNRPPQFVYGHLMITHKPHIYDATGRVRTTAAKMDDASLFTTYIDQVKKANTVIQELVSHILTHNRRNTVIMVMGDHGFRGLPPEQSAYYFPNFSAFYFPGKNPNLALRQISSVNTFRIVFNQYFCQNLSLLKDSSIIVKY